MYTSIFPYLKCIKQSINKCNYSGMAAFKLEHNKLLYVLLFILIYYTDRNSYVKVGLIFMYIYLISSHPIHHSIEAHLKKKTIDTVPWLECKFRVVIRIIHFKEEQRLLADNHADLYKRQQGIWLKSDIWKDCVKYRFFW